MNTRQLAGASLKSCTLILLVMFSSTGIVLAQEALRNGTVAPMGKWLEYRNTTHRGSPILVHLRIGYERAIVFPEPVKLANTGRTLPGCEIIINEDVVAFYPTRKFARQSVILTGTLTGTEYEISIRASTKGMRQPMRIERPE